MTKVITSERRGAEWRWPDPSHEPKISPMFARRYPRAAALAREMGLSVSSLWRPFTMFSASISLHGYGQCEAQCETRAGCSMELLEGAAPDA